VLISVISILSFFSGDIREIPVQQGIVKYRHPSLPAFD